MDSKQIKSTLKEAKEAFKNKEIDKALKLCKAVLKTDHKNYMALVLFGAALQESELKNDAPTTFKKAIEISPDQILAWQGLASYYEKEGRDKFADELLKVYKKLLLLERDNVKWKEIVQKLNDIIKYVNNEEFVEMFEIFLNFENELRLLIADTLYNYFSSLKIVSESYLHNFRKVLLIKIENDSASTDYIHKYLEVLYKQKEYKEFFTEFKRFFSVDNVDIYSLELLCKLYNELFVLCPDTSTFNNIDEFCDLLLKNKQNSCVGLLTKAIISYNFGNYVSCRDILYKVYDIDSNNWLIYYYLSKVYYRLYCFDEVVTNLLSCKKYLNSQTDANIEKNIEKLLIEALAKSENPDYCNECFQKCTEILSYDSTNEFAIKYSIRANIFLKKWELLESNLIFADDQNANSENTFLNGLYYYKVGDTEKAISLLKNKIQDELDYVESYLLLGKIYWEQTNYAESMNYFSTAANLDSYIYITYLYFGHFYRDIDKDFDKAKKCYQKAFQLNRNSEQIGIALSDIYRKLGLHEDNAELLKNITFISDAKWALLRLGLHYLDNNELDLAVKFLRSVVRKNSEDSCCWEILADSYFARGSYISALKSYQKSLEYNFSSYYASLQIATVKQRIGLLDESIDEFRDLVKKKPHFVPALKGLSECCLIQAKELFERQQLGSARDLCQEAVTALAGAVKQKIKFVCIWKLLADICILVCQLPVKISYLILSSCLFKKNLESDENENFLTIRKVDLLDFSLKCYLAAIHLSEGNKNICSFLWHDVAFCYNLQADFLDVNENVKLRSYAFVAAKKSVALDPKTWQNWNLLGLIASSSEINDASFAQHCFIQAIQVGHNSTVPWNNLGCFYLQFEDIQLANEAFRNAQRINPKYSRAWIGQAIIAEYVEDIETADLFYHSAGLGYHEESAKGLAEWICKILKNWSEYKNNHHCYYLIEKNYGLQIATVVLTWYTGIENYKMFWFYPHTRKLYNFNSNWIYTNLVHHPEDVWAANILSVLFELCNLNRNALSSCKISLQQASDEHKDIIRSNLGRQLRKIGEYKDALETYKKIREIDFTVQCDLALTAYLAGQREEALQHYESAIHWLAPDDGSVAEVMVAIAALNYLCNKKEEAKTTLFQCINLKPVPVYGLFAACAFGMLNSQLKLSKLVLKELEAFNHCDEYIPHIALFSTYCEVFQGEFQKAIRTMSKFIYKCPGNASLWLSFCLLFLNFIYSSPQEYIQYGVITAYHAKCAITLGKSEIDISKIYSIMSLSYLVSGEAEKSLKNSMKAVFIYPDVAENWAVLIAVQYSRGNDYPSLIRTIQYVRNRLNCSKSLNLWLINIEKKITAIIG